jgi:hypothetical protein
MQNDSPYFKVRDVLVCDDIRTEDNGKQILIGVYTGNILLNEFPASLLLSFWIDVNQPVAGQVPFQIRCFITGQSEPVFHIQGTGESSLPSPHAQISLRGVPLKVTRDDSVLRVELKQYEGEWEEIRTIDIKKNPSPSQQRLKLKGG